MLNKLKDAADIIRNRIRLNETFKDVFESPSGKEVLASLIKETGFFNPNVQMSDSLYKVGVVEGQRRVILHILKRMNYDNSKLTELLEMQDGLD